MRPKAATPVRRPVIVWQWRRRGSLGHRNRAPGDLENRADKRPIDLARQLDAPPTNANGIAPIRNGHNVRQRNRPARKQGNDVNLATGISRFVNVVDLFRLVPDTALSGSSTLK